jgi:RNA polymerase sigma factor (sigma-70 family)
MKEISKEMQDAVNAIFEEHKEIKLNPYRFVYCGNREFILDYNFSYDPTDDLIDDIDGCDEDIEDDSDRENRIALGNDMMQNLKPKDKELIELYFEEGWSFAKIGRKWNCTRQNVKYHFHRIIKGLKEKYEGDYNGLS